MRTVQLWRLRYWFFFFKCYGDHRDLHSFPTRRSSDPDDGCSGAASRSVGRSRKRAPATLLDLRRRDRKSTRLNSSHSQISYAVFCLKKKKKKQYIQIPAPKPQPTRSQ